MPRYGEKVCVKCGSWEAYVYLTGRFGKEQRIKVLGIILKVPTLRIDDYLNRLFSNHAN